MAHHFRASDSLTLVCACRLRKFLGLTHVRGTNAAVTGAQAALTERRQKYDALRHRNCLLPRLALADKARRKIGDPVRRAEPPDSIQKQRHVVGALQPTG